MPTIAETIAEIRDLTAYHLSDMSDCAGPDNRDSAGAVWLRDIRDSFLEEIGDEPEIDDPSDLAHEIADDAVYRLESCGTHGKWLVFVDLAAYQEDPSELGVTGSDMNKAADACLYLIGSRLVGGLAEMIDSAEEEEGDD